MENDTVLVHQVIRAYKKYSILGAHFRHTLLPSNISVADQCMGQDLRVGPIELIWLNKILRQ